MTAQPHHRHALEAAFHAFNARSAELESSYRALKNRVEELTVELHETQSARHRELLEKERLSERLRQTLAALPGAVVVLDAGGIVRDRNACAAELLSQPLRGRPWSEIVRREFAAGERADGELELNDGRILSLKRQRLGDGEILLLTDVTDSHRLRELLARRERLSAIGEMTARLAHQIRTPLASALLYATQLTPGRATPDSVAGRVVGRLRELDRTVNDMLGYAGGARGGDDLIDTAELLEDVAETAAARCGRGVTIEVCATDASPFVEGNRDAVKGALLNLVDNAANAAGNGARIELSAVQDGERACLVVSDNGPGIAPELAARVFEPFFTTRPQGTGLGLAVVKSVAEAHGGEVLLDNGAAGLSVALSLPAVIAAVSAAPREARYA